MNKLLGKSYKNGYQKCSSTVTSQKAFFVMVLLFAPRAFKPFVTIQFFVMLLAFRTYIVIFWISHDMPTSLINNSGSIDFNNLIATSGITFVYLNSICQASLPLS